MLAIYNRGRKLLSRDTGAALVEYGLLVALIAVVCIFAITDLGTTIRDKFQEVVDGLNPTA